MHSNSCNNICPNGPREFTCDATQPRSNRNCIDPNKKCDRRNDCDNAKDELDCIFMADLQTTAVPGRDIPQTKAVLSVQKVRK